jgi:alcohol dehydrogenase
MLTPSSTVQSLPGSRIRVIFHPGALDDLGPTAKREGATRALLVTDPGIVEAGHVERAMRSLYKAGIITRLYDGVGENPTTEHVARGLAIAKKFEVDFIIGLGGGSSMDCAKGINFLFSNGGKIEDYWGVNKAAKPMLPLIAIPTTAGTGSEAQSAALITDPVTHNKMACWDEKAAARVAILDPDLTATVPHTVAAATGIDAISHAVETAASTQRNDISRAFSREAWRLLSASFVRSLEVPTDADARQKMLLGAHLAGCAIENSMLGAAHACANPLTAHYGLTHGTAIGILLPHVIRFNALVAGSLYADLAHQAGLMNGDRSAAAGSLAQRITGLMELAELPTTLSACGVSSGILPVLAEEASQQWTGRFNPRPVTEADLLSLYEAAF